MADLGTRDGVQAWINEHGVDELRWQIEVGLIQHTGAKVGTAWLAEHDRKERERIEAEMREVAKQAVAASVWSARSAFLALLVAVASLIVSAWPAIKDIGR